MAESQLTVSAETLESQIPPQDLLNFAVSNSPTIFYIATLGKAQILKFISSNLETITGHTADTFLTKTGARCQMLHPEDLAAFRDTVNAMKARKHDN